MPDAPFPTPAAVHRPDGHAVSWETWDGAHREDATIRWDNEAYTVQGHVGRERVEYVLRLGPDWSVRQCLLFRDMDEPDLWLGHDGAGHWGEVGGARRPELDGCTHVWLPFTPMSHVPVVRGGPVDVGGVVAVRCVRVDAASLALDAVEVTYARVGSSRWRREAGTAGGAAGFTVDAHGIACDADGAFRRLGGGG